MEKEEAPKFDPNKGYQWQPEDRFLISGEDYSIISALVRSILSTNEAKTVMLAERASESLQATLIEAVEAGVAKEIIEDDKKTS